MNNTFTPKQVINESHVFVIGKKYRGRTVAAVIDFDPSYITWIRNKPWGKTDLTFMELTKDVAVPDLTFGRCKNKTLEWVRENDPNYWKFLGVSEWVQQNHPEVRTKVHNMNALNSN